MAWLIMVPVSILTHWIYSVAFIAAVSIYANFVTHVAGWRADEPDEQRSQLLGVAYEVFVPSTPRCKPDLAKRRALASSAPDSSV